MDFCPAKLSYPIVYTLPDSADVALVNSLALNQLSHPCTGRSKAHVTDKYGEYNSWKNMGLFPMSKQSQ